MINILIINGPNMNMLGKREANQYGNISLNDIIEMTNNYFKNKVKCDWFQSNSESEIINKLHGCVNQNYDCLILNPAAFTHHSIAIYDALLILKNLFKIEVHLSNTHSRENFRQKKITTSACDCVIEGFKESSYKIAINAYILKKESDK